LAKRAGGEVGGEASQKAGPSLKGRRRSSMTPVSLQNTGAFRVLNEQPPLSTLESGLSMCENVSSHFQFLAKQNLTEIEDLSEKLATVYQTHLPETHVTSLVEELQDRRRRELEQLSLSLTKDAASKLDALGQESAQEMSKRDLTIQEVTHTNDMLKSENIDLSNALQRANQMLLKSKDIIVSHQRKLDKTKEKVHRVKQERVQAKALVRQYGQNLVDLERTVSKRMEDLREISSDQKHTIETLEKDLERALASNEKLQEGYDVELVRANRLQQDDTDKHLLIVEYKVLIDNGKLHIREKDALIKDLKEKYESNREEQLSLAAKVVLLNEENGKLQATERETTESLKKARVDLKSTQEELFYEKRLGADRKIGLMEREGRGGGRQEGREQQKGGCPFCSFSSFSSS
jgi:hypothetical protein